MEFGYSVARNLRIRPLIGACQPHFEIVGYADNARDPLCGALRYEFVSKASNEPG